MTDAEIGRTLRKATKGLRVKRRRLYNPLRNVDRDNQYLESDNDYFENNRKFIEAVLDAFSPPPRKRKTKNPLPNDLKTHVL